MAVDRKYHVIKWHWLYDNWCIRHYLDDPLTVARIEEKLLPRNWMPIWPTP